MKPPSRVALQLLLAAGAVVASGTAVSAEPVPPCQGWETAAEHSDAGPVTSLAAFCGIADGSFKQGFPIKWQG